MSRGTSLPGTDERLMTQQLTFFGTWEAVRPEPPPEAPAPQPAPPPPVDPRQTGLFEGPHSCRRAAELACEALCGASLRAAVDAARSRYPTWDGADPWPGWADGLDGLDAPTALGLVERALALEGPAGARRFPGMSPARLHIVRGAALARAARRLAAEQGAIARLPDGRPLGFLYLLAGQLAEAVDALLLAERAAPGQGLVLGYLGEALWRAGHEGEAIATYRDAYLYEPAAVDERELTCRPIMDLLDSAEELELDEPRAWLPVVADLLGQAPLPPGSAVAPAGASAARQAAALLYAHRQAQGRPGQDPARVERKRALLALAPTLREHIRRL